MKKILSSIALLLCTFVAQAADLSEDFSSLSKGKYGANNAVTLSLPSGDWEALKMELKENNGVKQFTFSSGTSSYLITPALDDPGKISVDWGSGGSNKLVINYSVNDGAWQQLAEIASGGSGAKSYSAKTGLDGETNVRFRFVGSSSNTYVSKVVIKSANVVPVDPEDPTYITEGTWVPTKAFPTATKTLYIAPDGNDQTGDGSIDKPWFELGKAINAATSGTHIICRGGTYKMKVQSDGKFTVRLKKSGTAESPIVIRCYDGEKPVFDFVDGLTVERIGERGLTITGDYWWLFGLHITHAADNGIKLEGSHNRIERCEFSYNLDSGIQLGFGHKFSDTFPGVSQNDGSYCSYNDIIDCDSHHNCDYDSNYGSDADGFACKMHNGIGNRFIRCRAWHNSDDAWDCFETDYSVILAECWAWESGKPEDHLWVKDYITKNSSMSFSGNGNGIKLGGNGTGGSSKGIHYAFNCISWGHNKSGSVKGFDCNSHKDGHVLVGCLAFDNGYDYMFEGGGSDANTKYYNNVCLGKQEIDVGYDNYNALTAPMSKNGWTNHLVTGVSKDDYITLEEDDALLPRDIYGGMPRRFGRLTADPENKLVDAGNENLDDVNGVWQQLIRDFPFLARTVTGTTRDLGPYERPDNTAAISVVSGSTADKTFKVVRNGRLVIMKDGKQYNVQGQTLSLSN
ncbi:MAG: hypothetical protein IJT53_00060 [Prevotella sp.]|nr:hypothetical protein [Prevotella sp.]